MVKDTGFLTNNWEEFIIYMLDGVEKTSIQTTNLIRIIKTLMKNYKNQIKSNLPKIYSQDLLNNLFNHPYTKIEFLCEELNIDRRTAAKYLNQLVDMDMLIKQKIKKDNYYLNHGLFVLLSNVDSVF